MIELEKTYLAKKLPKNLKNYKFKEIIDIYIPKSNDHPKLRLRKNGNKFEITKKEPVQPVDNKDISRQKEQTIILTEIEFNALNKLEGKRIHKIRYYFDYNGQIAEFDIFQDSLKGLVIVDFEFKTIKEKENFQMPNFCLTDIVVVF
ncbi:MAG: hypothetical protein ABH808_01655 [Candidatus Kuenenbacteria bacterium]